MDCGCIYVDVDTPPSFHHEKMVRAMKEHRCCECGRTITPGERYEKVAGVWDGEFNTYKTCDDCLSIRDSFFCDGWGYTSIYEHLYQHICDMKGRIGEECILSLTPCARDLVFNAIEETWHEMDLDEEEV